MLGICSPSKVENKYMNYLVYSFFITGMPISIQAEQMKAKLTCNWGITDLTNNVLITVTSISTFLYNKQNKSQCSISYCWQQRDFLMPLGRSSWAKGESSFKRALLCFLDPISSVQDWSPKGWTKLKAVGSLPLFLLPIQTADTHWVCSIGPGYWESKRHHNHGLQKGPWPRLPSSPCNRVLAPHVHHSQPGGGSHDMGSAKERHSKVKIIAEHQYFFPWQMVVISTLFFCHS